MENIINIFKQNPQLLILVIIGILYFLLNICFPSKKGKKDENEIDYDKMRKKRTNYTETYSTSIYEATNDVTRPKDGGSIHAKGSAGYKKTNKHKYTQETLARQTKYEELFAKKIKNLNHVARSLQIVNDVVVDDLKYFQKKKHIFLDISIDIINCRIKYGDELEDDEEIVIDEEFIEDDDMENDFETNDEDDEYFDEDEQIKRKCPKCGTVNIVDIGDTDYRCFFCLSKNEIK